MFVVQTEAAGRCLAVAEYSPGLLFNEPRLQDVIQYLQSLLLPVGPLQKPAQQVDLVRSANSVGSPAWSLEVSEVVPSHHLAIRIDEAGDRHQVTVFVRT